MKATDNPLLTLIRTAHQQNWCTVPYCTTCGAHEYRQALSDLSGPLGGGLANALAEIEPRELTTIPGWQDALLVAVIDLPILLQVEGVLETWLLRATENIAFSDFVLYKIVRHLGKDNPVCIKWIDRCRSLALNTGDFSLVESLVLVLGKSALKDPDLIALATDHARSSSQMRRVLRNACGLDVPVA